VLFFFALYAYLIFALPLYVHRLGPEVFMWSTVFAVLLFALFICVLSFSGRSRLASTLPRIMAGSALVVGAVVFLYFSGLIPPIPLTIKESGIYQNVVHTEAGYQITHERSSRWSRFIERTVHHVPGTPLYAYTAIFAPTAFSANVVHRWERYDERQRTWVQKSMVAFTLSGGRSGGYRGYSIKSDPEPGTWRVTIETTEGQVIGQLRFEVVNVARPPRLYTETR
jgi:hypothetical protein